MILPDVNTLLYAVNRASAQHALAREALRQGQDQRGIAFAWTALLAFLRLTTHRGIFPKPLSVEEALAVVGRWLGHPHSRVVHPGERHIEILGGLLKSAGAGGNLTTDAHLAALAIEHGATIVSFDRDFARFQGLRWTLPAAD
jgi:toxin-antitoxin system PIN domain toxin